MHGTWFWITTRSQLLSLYATTLLLLCRSYKTIVKISGHIMYMCWVLEPTQWYNSVLVLCRKRKNGEQRKKNERNSDQVIVTTCSVSASLCEKKKKNRKTRTRFGMETFIFSFWVRFALCVMASIVNWIYIHYIHFDTQYLCIVWYGNRGLRIGEKKSRWKKAPKPLN